jgi:sarcosine oxidase gamma subunit
MTAEEQKKLKKKKATRLIGVSKGEMKKLIAEYSQRQEIRRELDTMRNKQGTPAINRQKLFIENIVREEERDVGWMGEDQLHPARESGDDPLTISSRELLHGLPDQSQAAVTLKIAGPLTRSDVLHLARIMKITATVTVEGK